MGEARRRALAGLGRPAGSPRLVAHTLLLPDALARELAEALVVYNAARAEQAQGAVAFQDFLVHGVIREGLAAFHAAQAAHQEASRLVKLPHEVAAGG